MNEDKYKDRVEIFKGKLIELCKEFNVSLKPEDRESCLIIHTMFDESIIRYIEQAPSDIEYYNEN